MQNWTVICVYQTEKYMFISQYFCFCRTDQQKIKIFSADSNIVVHFRCVDGNRRKKNKLSEPGLTCSGSNRRRCSFFFDHEVHTTNGMKHHSSYLSRKLISEKHTLKDA